MATVPAGKNAQVQIHTSCNPKYPSAVQAADARHCSGQALMVSLRDKNNARVFISALAM
jgi:hypothetical protein